MVGTLVDPRLTSISPGSIPADWATRALFCHPGTFDRWTARSQEIEDLEGQEAMCIAYLAMMRRLNPPPQTFISLGAGGGMVDKTLLSAIAPRPDYVPIDISRPMCELAARRLREVCPVRLAVVADFEDGFDFLRGALSPLAGTRKLFACIGNTVGNLDRGERNLLGSTCSLMEAGDALLASVATGAFGLPIDRRRFDREVGWSDLSGLLASGIAMITGEDIAAAEAALDDRLVVHEGRSDVPGTESLVLSDRVSGRALLHLRRYALDRLQQWIADTFPLHVLARDEWRPPQASFGVGVLLLTRAG